MKEKQMILDYLDFLDKSVTNMHAVHELENILRENNFVKLNRSENWKLENNKSYYITVNSSSIFAFRTGRENEKFKIVGSHSDSPGFRIKPKSNLSKNSYIRLNTEVYGGPIFTTWLDRELSMAGRVFLKSDDPFKPIEKLVNIEKDLITIPNLAIHMNREINKGYEYNPQVDLLPILGQITSDLEKDDFLIKILCEKLNVEADNILDFDLYLYPRDKAKLVGYNEEFIASGRQDNLSMAYASVVALINTEENDSVNIASVFDNEEIGSSTMQGADSPVLENLLKRISLALGKSEEEYLISLDRSFIISADMAHAVHPNQPNKTDETNNCKINSGPVIKYAANKAYTSDGYSASVFKALCDKAEVPYQEFTNRSDSRGGSTIGPITSSQLGINSVDIGNALLAMHSIRELGGSKDQIMITKVFEEFYK